MEHMGNSRSNSVFNPDETKNPPPTNSNQVERDSELEIYIRKKYISKSFIRRSASIPPPTRGILKASNTGSSTGSNNSLNNDVNTNTSMNSRLSLSPSTNTIDSAFKQRSASLQANNLLNSRSVSPNNAPLVNLGDSHPIQSNLQFNNEPTRSYSLPNSILPETNANKIFNVPQSLSPQSTSFNDTSFSLNSPQSAVSLSPQRQQSQQSLPMSLNSPSQPFATSLSPQPLSNQNTSNSPYTTPFQHHQNNSAGLQPKQTGTSTVFENGRFQNQATDLSSQPTGLGSMNSQNTDVSSLGSQYTGTSMSPLSTSPFSNMSNANKSTHNTSTPFDTQQMTTINQSSFGAQPSMNQMSPFNTQSSISSQSPFNNQTSVIQQSPFNMQSSVHRTSFNMQPSLNQPSPFGSQPTINQTSSFNTQSNINQQPSPFNRPMNSGIQYQSNSTLSPFYNQGQSHLPSGSPTQNNNIQQQLSPFQQPRPSLSPFQQQSTLSPLQPQQTSLSPFQQQSTSAPLQPQQTSLSPYQQQSISAPLQPQQTSLSPLQPQQTSLSPLQQNQTYQQSFTNSPYSTSKTTTSTLFSQSLPTSTQQPNNSFIQQPLNSYQPAPSNSRFNPFQSMMSPPQSTNPFQQSSLI